MRAGALTSACRPRAVILTLPGIAEGRQDIIKLLCQHRCQSDGSLSPDSFRARRMLVTEEMGHQKTFMLKFLPGRARCRAKTKTKTGLASFALAAMTIATPCWRLSMMQLKPIGA